MTGTRTRRAALAAVALMTLASTSAAQEHGATRSDDRGLASWRTRVRMALRHGQFRPDGESELYSLVDQASTPGADALRPRLSGGDLAVRVRGDWHATIGIERGGRSVVMTSAVAPTVGGGVVQQRTSLDFTSMMTLGTEWSGARVRALRVGPDDRVRLALGGGLGSARYALRQVGDFVDATRRVTFADDFRSSGRGTFGFVSIAADVPLSRWIAIRGDVRRQEGSAPMSADYATFDRLDVGGTRFGIGVVVGAQR